ncbi:MAG: hypothetical protein ACR2O1_13190 [Boseongicola sp.]
MRRDAGHWLEIASEKLEGADIEHRLQCLFDRVEPSNPVFIFLPRDQILYTNVKVNSDSDAASDIDRALSGQTPYEIEELEIDWEQRDPGEARVAAIARETLDEAEVFANARGLVVAGFSALADPSDFPRLPDFGGAAIDLLSDDEEVLPEPTPTFTSRRTSQPPPSTDGRNPKSVTSDDLTPVVRVDDPTPVMQLPESDLPPLDPGEPLPRVRSEPRVVTDVGAISASAPAASLTAEPPVYLRRRDRAVPTPALATIAALLSVGIAIVIWAILPTTPDTPDLAAPAPKVVQSKEPEDSAAAPIPEPTAPAISEIAPTVVILDIAPPRELKSSPAPEVPFVVAKQPVRIALSRLPDDTFSSGIAPTHADELEKRPQSLAGVENAGPASLSSNSAPLTETSRGITIAALDGIVPKTDAVALPVPRIDLEATIDTDPPVRRPDPEDIAALPDTENAPIVEESDVESRPNATEALPDTELYPDPPTVENTVVEPTEQVPDPGELELIPTELARALPDRAPLARPQDFTTRIERQNYGGRTLTELQKIRPGPRPASAQIEALVALASREPSELAVVTSLPPRNKPVDFDAIVAATQVQREAERQAAVLAARVPDTNAAIEAALAEDTAAEEGTRPQDTPRLAIPSSASVARQATLENAIRLNRINLVGVYGLSSDRRALVRLPSGRYVKVKVGDRVDGGTVASISESELRYTKRGKTIALKMPKG